MACKIRSPSDRGNRAAGPPRDGSQEACRSARRASRRRSCRAATFRRLAAAAALPLRSRAFSSGIPPIASAAKSILELVWLTGEEVPAFCLSSPSHCFGIRTSAAGLSCWEQSCLGQRASRFWRAEVVARSRKLRPCSSSVPSNRCSSDDVEPAEGSVCNASTNGMKKSSSTDFLLISECVNQTVQGMWGNAPRPEPVREIKRIERDLSVGFGPWKEDAAALLRADALRGELPIYVRPRPTLGTQGRPSVEPRRVPPELLKRVLPVRRSLPDHPTHVRCTGVHDGRHDDALLLLLRHGELVVRKSDFTDWYKHNRAKGNWPSQTDKRGSRRGRPTKDTGSLRNAILALVHNGEWRASDGILRLRRLLVEKGRDPPGRDTLAQAVDRLHRVTGELAFGRKVRRRSQPQTSSFAEKSKPFSKRKS
jgi:hypothetical protein